MSLPYSYLVIHSTEVLQVRYQGLVEERDELSVSLILSKTAFEFTICSQEKLKDVREQFFGARGQADVCSSFCRVMNLALIVNMIRSSKER